MSFVEKSGGVAPNGCKDVTVIGAGWSGLLACKSMLEEGLSVIALEKRDDIGGVWKYTEDPTVPSVMKSTQCTSSSTLTEISDYPMPQDIGMFPHHSDVLDYLKAYAREFNLLPHIKLSTKVEAVEKKPDNTWEVSCAGGEVYKSRFLVVAAGLHQLPNRELEGTMLKGFTGKILHAVEVKHRLEEFKNKRLLVLGGGETASDICMDWFHHAKFIYWSIPRGQHFFRKYAKIVPWAGNPQPLDKSSSRMHALVTPFPLGTPGGAWLGKWATNGSLLAYQGHGIPEWKNDASWYHFFINKNGSILDLVDYKNLVPKGAIVKCKGGEVTFTDGSTDEFDIVIMSTGYNMQHPYLPKHIKVRELHKMVFDIEDPSLAFVGLVRPVIGSLVAISELQARWVAKVFAQKVELKSLEERKKDVEQDKAHWSDYFKHSSQRIEGLVEAYTYSDDIARHAQIYPDYWSLFKRNPKQWMTAYFAPGNAAMYRLNEQGKCDLAINTMTNHNKGMPGLLQFLLLFLLRLIWFDWWVDHVSTIKYHIQTSSWWPIVRSWRITKGLNQIWTLPKKILFDNTSDFREQMSARAKVLVNSVPSEPANYNKKIQ